MLVQVRFDHIRPTKPYEVDEVLDRDAFDAMVSGFEDHHAESELRVKLELRRINNRRVVVEGRLSGQVSGPCSRCLEPVPYALEVEVFVTFEPEGAVVGSGADGEEIELSSDDLDVMTYRDGVIDLEELVRESLILELKPFPPCPESDPERCAEYARRIAELAEGVADEALSEGDDGGERPIDPRWASLKALKTKQGRGNGEPD